MINIFILIVGIGLCLQALIGLSFFVSSIREKEHRASVFGGLQFLGMLGLVILFFLMQSAGFFNTFAGVVILICLLIIGVFMALILAKKTAANPKALAGTGGLIQGKVKRYDEREIVFARNRSLPPDPGMYQQFYEKHPQWETYDTARRKKGGTLGIPGTIDSPHDRPNVAATFASLSIPLYLSTAEKIRPRSHPLFQEQRIEMEPETATQRIIGFTRSLGADLAGITEINPLWIYSHRGEIFHENWADWGREIELTHKYAVVFATEMGLEMVGTAPHTPTTIASMGNYAKGAYIAVQVAAYIANLGYSSTANHLRHYDMALVPLAVDAGLGELGRLGYLMTQKFGPRIRLSAVTTDLPLKADKPVDIGVDDFCRICKKCARCCPSNSIPFEDQTEVNGTLRWKLNAETCFDYWGKVGTDCNICMRVCPWSHATTLPHKIIRTLITRNRTARRLFSVMDDIFYGRKPKPKAAPDWAQFNATS
ncbi:MAG: reductive dehalogenase [Deltaproteobacteria bacterium]|nr:reductive dehalogenase [Deltaproteobacteria bacterium]